MNSYRLLSFLLIIILLFNEEGLTQAKTASKQPPTPILKKMLNGSGLPFKVVNDSMLIVPFEGENLAAYDVVIRRTGGLLVIYSSLIEAIPVKTDEKVCKYLLEQNDHFDLVKIGLSGEGELYLRADLYWTTVSTAILTRVIRQVANVTNIIAGDFRQAR